MIEAVKPVPTFVWTYGRWELMNAKPFASVAVGVSEDGSLLSSPLPSLLSIRLCLFPIALSIFFLMAMSSTFSLINHVIFCFRAVVSHLSMPSVLNLLHL